MAAHAPGVAWVSAPGDSSIRRALAYSCASISPDAKRRSRIARLGSWTLAAGCSVLVTRAIDDFALSIPIGSLVFLLVASAVAGVLAAILPARRAAKLDVLESLSYE